MIACASMANAQCCDNGQTSRAALLNGGVTACEAGECPEGCEKDCCKDKKDGDEKDAANTVYVAVDGMTCGACSGKVTKALAAIDGVTVKKVCHKSGSAKVVIDPAKTDQAAVVKAIDTTGFKVKGDIVSMNVDGMTCGACSGKLSKALADLDGVTVKKVCHKSGTATLVLTDKASTEAIAKTVTDTGFSVKK